MVEEIQILRQRVAELECADAKRKEAEDALRASETQYRRLTEMMRDVVWTLDAETLRFTYVSPSVIHLHGYTPEEIMAAPMDIALSTEHADAVRQLIAQRSAEFLVNEAEQEARYYRDEVQLLCKNGTLVWTEAITRYTRNPISGRLEVYGVTRDIHDRKQAEAALRESEERFRALFEQANNSIVILDPDTAQVIACNRQAYEHLGYTHEEFLRKHIPDVDIVSQNEALTGLREVLERGYLDFETRQRNKTGEIREMLIHASRIFYQNQYVVLGIGQDITARKQTEEALRQSEAALREHKQKLDQLIATVPVGIYTFRVLPDGSGRFEFMSQRAGEIFGIDPQAALRDSTVVGNVLHPEDRADYLQTSITANQTVQQTVWEGRILVQDATRWIRVESWPYLQANGDILWHGSLMDVTARRQSEEAVKDHHANLLAILENTEDIICSRDREHRLTFFNTAFANIFRRLFKREAAAGLDTFALLPEAIQQCLQPIVTRVLAGERYHEEFEWDFGDGDIRTYEIAFNPIFKDNEVIGYSEFNRDVTVRKLVEQALRASEERYQQMINLSPDAILVHVNDTIVFVNPAALQLLGFDDMRDLLGQSSIAFVHPEDQPKILERRRLARLGQITSSRIDVRIRRSDGSFLHVAITSFMLMYHGQSAIQAILRDISERKRAEEALQQAKEAAEAANRAKSAFLGKISHELRTPLNSILGYAQVLLSDPAFNSKHREKVEVIERSGQHLLTTINDILDLAKVEAGRVELHPAPLSLSSLLNDIQGMMKMKAEQKGLRFQIIRETGLVEYVEGDAHRLRQILLNLLGNAIKFTDCGSVTLRVGTPFCDNPEHVGAAPLVQPLFFEISDTGVGIAPEELSKLFIPFQQVGSAARKAQGTGLGLAISRHLVELMGGTLSVASTIGRGSVFRFEVTLPISQFSDTSPVSSRFIASGDDVAPTILATNNLAENRRMFTELQVSSAKEQTQLSSPAAIPNGMIERLRIAATLADMQEIYNVISELREINPILAEKLAKLAHHFEYGKMARLLIEGDAGD